MTKEYDHSVVIQTNWQEHINNNCIYLYTFSKDSFTLYDKVAGYYISEKPVTPLSVRKIANPYQELNKTGVAVIFTSNLKIWAEDIQKSTFGWSIIKYKNL